MYYKSHFHVRYQNKVCLLLAHLKWIMDSICVNMCQNVLKCVYLYRLLNYILCRYVGIF